MSLFILENVKYEGILSYPLIEIKKCKTTFFCGESGCGKSTLLKLLNGVVSVSNGTIYYNGSEINSYNPIELRREVLLVSQSVYLFDNSIRDNFFEYYDYRNLEKPNDHEIHKFLQLCCIDFPLDTPCTNMSGGEKQRIFIAICMSFMPKVLLLDEPTSALDDNNAFNLMTNIKEFCRENDISLIVVSHNKALAEKFGDEIINLIGCANE